MNVYISGPMTGLQEFNYPAFNTAAYALRDRGYCVLNPAENVHPKGAAATWNEWMELAQNLFATATHVVTLPGWENSRGARIEVNDWAAAKSLPVCTLEEFMSNNVIPLRVESSILFNPPLRSDP